MRIRQILVMVLLCFATLLSYALVLDAESDLEQLRKMVLYERGYGGISLSNVESVNSSLSAWCETNGESNASFVCWSQIDDQDIYQHSVSRGVRADVVIAYGDISLLTQNAQSLNAGNANGCVISNSASRELFGTSNTIGLQLEYGGAVFTVRSIAPIDDPILILPFDGNPNSQRIIGTANSKTSDIGRVGEGDNRIANNAFTSQSHYASISDASFCFAAVAGSESYIQQFESLYASFENSSISTEAYRIIGAICSGLLPSILLLVLSVYAIRRVFKYRSHPVLCVVLGFSSVLLVVLFWFLFCSVPRDIPLTLPNRWSDFAFWEGLLGESLETIKAVLFGSQEFVTLPYWSSVVHCIFGSAVSIMAFFGLVVQSSFFMSGFCVLQTMTISAAKCVLIGILGIAGIEAAVLIAANCLSLTLANWHLLVCMLPVFTLGVFLLRVEYFDGG